MGDLRDELSELMNGLFVLENTFCTIKDQDLVNLSDFDILSDRMDRIDLNTEGVKMDEFENNNRQVHQLLQILVGQ